MLLKCRLRINPPPRSNTAERPSFTMAGGRHPGATGPMRIGYVPAFAIVLVLGWSAPDPTQPDLGLAAQARATAHAHKKLTKRYQAAQKRAVRKRVASKAVTRRSAPPVRLAWAGQQSLSSSLALDPPIPPIKGPSPPEPQAPTPDEQMEKLRVGLQKLARTYPSPEEHLERLRVGLEKLARAMNGES